MRYLPWLLLHGAAAWRVGLVLAAVTGAALAWLWPLIAARREAARARAKLGDAASPRAFEDGEVVTLSGELVATGAPCQRFEDGAEAAIVSAAAATGARGMQRERGALAWAQVKGGRAERLELRTERGPVELLGPIEVLTASREVLTGRAVMKLPAAASARVLSSDGASDADPAWWSSRALALRSIANGERVRVRGVLRREAATSRAASYRGADGEWTLVAEPPLDTAGGLQLCHEQAPRVIGIAWARIVVVAVTASLVFAGATYAGGTIAIRIARDRLRELRVAPQRALDASAVAALSPSHRAAALDELAHQMGMLCLDDYSQAHLERTVAVGELRNNDCGALADVLIRHGLLERAAEVAARCGAHRIEARAEYLLGRFERASRAVLLAGHGDHLTDELFDLRVHLLGGRRSAAAEAARWAVEKERPGSSMPTSRGAGLECIARALDPSEDARRALVRDVVSAANTTPACALLAADAQRGADRIATLGALATRNDTAELLLLEAELSPNGPDTPRTAAPCPIDDGEDPESLRRPTRIFGHRSLARATSAPGLLLSALASLGNVGARCRRKGRLAAEAAVYLTLAGNHREARRWAEVAASALAEGPIDPAPFGGGADRAPPGSSADRAVLLRAAVELYAGDVVQARTLIAGRGPARSDVAELSFIADVREDRATVIPAFLSSDVLYPTYVYGPWSLVVARDTPGLARWMQRHDSDGAGPFLHLGARRLEVRREEIVAWLRWGDKASCWSCGPHQVLFETVSRKDAAEALGERALGVELAAITASFQQALAQRDHTVLLAVLDAL